jgi:hypothetical protein
VAGGGRAAERGHRQQRAARVRRDWGLGAGEEGGAVCEGERDAQERVCRECSGPDVCQVW